MNHIRIFKEHTSNPVNPVLANPVYLSGYIEQMGTGTTDIINHCLEYGLRKPEFHQDDDFRVVLWRPEVQEGGEVRGKKGVQQGVQERVQEDSNNIKIVSAIRGDTVSADEIRKTMNLKGRSNFTIRYLNPSIEKGFVAPLYPDAPKLRDQAYYLSTFYENKSICQYMLSYIWSNAQQNVPLQNLIEIFIPDSVPDSKTDKGLSVCQKYLNTLPRWYLKGHSPEETVRLFPRTTPPQLKLGPNLTAQGFEINPEFQEHVNKHWNEPDNLFEGTPFIQTGPKVGRNDPCPCGSGKKYKHCCGK